MNRRDPAAAHTLGGVTTDAYASLNRPPPHPTPPHVCALAEHAAGKENVQAAAPQWHSQGEMRGAPALGHGVRQRENFPPPPTRTAAASALVELEGILTYVECVTASLAHRARAPMPSESVRAISGSMVAPRRIVASEQQGAAANYSLAMSLHESANSLLSCFSKLEYVTLSQSDTLEDIERKVSKTSGDVNLSLDAIEMRYATHEDPDVQEFFIGSRQTIEDCRRVVQSLVQAANHTLSLRRVVAKRDVVQAKKLFTEHQQEYSKGGVTRLQSPLFTWVEKKWFLAMETWSRIVATSRKEAEASTVASALASAHQKTIAQSDLISEILRPGETLSDLLRKELDEPLSLLETSLKKVKDNLDALRAAIAMPEVKKLTECVFAVEELMTTGQLKSSADKELLKEGKRLIVRLQQVENLEVALRLAAQVGETVTLFRTIHHANEIMLQLRIAGDMAANRETVTYCNKLLEEMCKAKNISPTDFIARRVDPGSITVAHVPSHIWSTGTTAAYQAACQSLATRIAQDLVRLELERVMHGGGDNSSLCLTATINGSDDFSNTSSSNPSLSFARKHNQFPRLKPSGIAELRAALKQANEVGLNGKLVQESEALLRSAEVLKLKVHFDAQLRLVLIQDPENATFEDIYKKVSGICCNGQQSKNASSESSGKKLRLRYQDSDGDCISLVTQEDWNVFVREEAPNGVCGAKLELYCDYIQLPQARVPDTVLTSVPSVEMEGGSTAKIMDGPAKQSEIKETHPRVMLTPQRRDGTTPNGAGVNTLCTARCRSARIGLRRADYLLSQQIPRRMAMDDLSLPKNAGMPNNSVAEPENSGDKAECIRGRPREVGPRNGNAVETDPNSKKNNNNQARSITPRRSGRCRLHSVRLGATPTRPVKSLVPQTQKKPQLLIKSTMAVSHLSRGDESAAVAVEDTSAAPASSLFETSTGHTTSATTPASLPASASAVSPPPVFNSHVHKNNKKTATIPPTTESAAVLCLQGTKKWNEDDVQLDLETVASVVSTSRRPVVSIKKVETSAKQPTEAKRPGSGFTVTPCSKGTPFYSGMEPAQDPAKEKTRNPGDIIVLEERREWSTDMFILNDVCTVISEQTSLPESATQSVLKVKPVNEIKNFSSINSFQGGGRGGGTAPMAPPVNDSVKKKVETLQQLRQLREENQKALKAALCQRRTGK